METININMTPCNEVETIHASQNDTSLRKWGIRPYDYDGNDVTNQQDKATLVDIKGQTLKWNQFCCKGRYFTRGSNEWQNTYTDNGVTFTYLDDYTVRITGTPTARTYIYVNRLDDSANYPVKPGEKLLLRCSDIPNGIDIFSSFYYENTWKGAGPQKSNKYVTVPSDVNKLVCMGIDVQASLIGQTIDVTVSLNVFNLTQMFGSGNEPTEEEFNALFPFYYPYNSGSLIPFMGNGLKTVGKNLLPKARASNTMNGITWTLNEDGTIHAEGTSTGRSYIRVTIFNENNFMLPKGDYVYTLAPSGSGIDNILSLIGSYKYGSSSYYKNVVYARSSNNFVGEFSVTDEFADCVYDIAIEIQTSGKTVNCDIKPMIRSASVSDATYEPYTESVINLPISTYFPSGMNKVNDTYDEWTPTKTTIRTNTIVFDGTEEFTTGGQGGVNFVYIIPNQADYGKFNIYGLYSKGQWGTYEYNATESQYGTVSFGTWEADRICFLAVGLKMTMEQFRQELASAYASGSPYEVCYELATPIETAISPELDLTFNIDKGGTEELLPSSLMNGSVDLGSLTWTYDSSVPRFYSTAISSVVAKPSNDNTKANIFCSKYATSAVSASSGGIYASGTDKLIAVGTTGTLNVKDSSYTDATAFKESLQGVYLWYETTDSTPTTTPLNATVKYPAETKDVYFTYQVSDFLSTIFKFYLVTKGIQIPCELEDDTLVADCTSEISNEPGFFDCKIKAENDLGQIFSNKFQLHIERSPQ